MTAVVKGASMGIGKAIASRLGSMGASVVIVACVLTKARYSTGNVFHVSGGVVMG